MGQTDHGGIVLAIERALLAYPGVETADPVEIRRQARLLGRYAPEPWEKRFEDTTRGAALELGRLSKAAAKLIKLLEQGTAAPTRRALEGAGFAVVGEHGLDDVIDLLRRIERAKRIHQETNGRSVKREAPRDTRALPLAVAAGTAALKLNGRRPSYTTPFDHSFGSARTGPFIGLVRDIYNILEIKSASVESAVVEAVKILKEREISVRVSANDYPLDTFR